MVIAVQNSQQNKKKKKEIVELNFGINYTLQQTIAMLKILNVMFNVSLNTQSTHLQYHEPNHFISPLKTSNEAVNLSTTTELDAIVGSHDRFYNFTRWFLP